ncbi:flagellar hook-length control protein FliK [Oxalobacter sp. OttesenSCG-928-P03]|nr:flagellar hook-length control protein FliK [Oxalobacter sp. OttesenSCG-928-P03]
MELRSDVTGTRPVAQTAGISQVSPAGDLKQDVYARLMATAVGRPLAAEVLSQTESGTSMVRVADTVVQMDLPPDAKVGERVTLTLLAKEPRLTFLFEREPAAHASVSNTGRLIDNILRSVSQDGGTATLLGRTPLFPTPPSAAAGQMLPSGLAASLESMLSNMFSTSGLFYESHLAQWVAGNRSQAELMAEPQAKMHNPAQNQALAQGADQMNRLEALQEKSWVASLMSKAASKVAAAVSQQPDRTEQVIDRDAANMIRMQLDALEQRKIIWQGELWPGQEMEWEVEDETPRQKREYGEAAEGAWQSVLRVNLPLLGSVTATMRLVGDTVQVQLGAADEASTSLLRQFGPELVAALESAGAKLDYFTVNDETA